ncbi:hypothetical protein QBC47DRAFT_430849 [Echria macrotheca]|uniref:NmrA-like domain-containing protein n=1 Tax=Echria macrotheca TaxID=438768 RepID=A0AAJ0B989_9PEZI|nr:hypothetical protein QBC47DRAFT_430849 [Echria macrotheca]
MSRTIFIIGGTGAQGLPIIRSLVQDPSPYTVRILTRDPSSRRAQSLAALSPQKVHLQKGTFTSEADLRAGFTGAWGAFVNIDGFATGEAMETYWTIRCFEIAIECGVQMYVHGNLDYVYKLAGYDPALRCGHYDGKGRMGEWILLQRQQQQQQQSGVGQNGKGMRAALFTTGPYIEMALAPHTPMEPFIENDSEGGQVLVWKVPLSESGGVAHVALDDCGPYVRWLFDNPARADGMDLAVAIGSVSYSEMASAFEKVTGHKARYEEITLDAFFALPNWARVADRPTGYMVTDPNSPAVMSMRDNFSGFWRMWQASGGNDGLIRRDYKLLDEIHPGRIKSAEEFFRREDEKTRKDGRGGLWEVVLSKTPVLKVHEDRGRAPQSR